MNHEAVLWPSLILGFLIAVFGWMIYWTGVHVIGAFVGGGVGVGLGWLAGIYFTIPGWELPMIGIGAVSGAVLGVIFMRSLQYYFFFLLGATAGAPLALSILSLDPLHHQPWAKGNGASIVAMLIGGLLGGILALKGRRYIVALVSAAMGAALIAVSLPDTHRALIAIPCFLTSLFVQTGFIRTFISEDDIEIERAIQRSRRERRREARLDA